jgi:hypothetical protein
MTANTAVGIRRTDHVTPYPQKLALTSPTSGGRSVDLEPLAQICITRSATEMVQHPLQLQLLGAGNTEWLKSCLASLLINLPTHRNPFYCILPHSICHPYCHSKTYWSMAASHWIASCSTLPLLPPGLIWGCSTKRFRYLIHTTKKN